MPAPPRYVRELELAVGSRVDYEEAVVAITQEHLASSQWKHLHCLHVEAVDVAEGIFRVDTGSALDFETSWEGGTALRLREEGDARSSDDLDPADPSPVIWAGPVVEVDDTAGALYIGLENGLAPTPGEFHVRPFDFTALLHRLYTDPAYDELRPALRGALRACLRGVEQPSYRALSTPWPSRWNVLWGPPGTGKTHLIGERVAQLLADPTERILVVSTTNVATDQVALSIGRAVRGSAGIGDREILRVGAGARYGRYAEAQMVHLLEGEEHALRRELERLRTALEHASDKVERAQLRRRLGQQLGGLRGAAKVAACDPQRRALVTTAYQALTYAADVELSDASSTPFTTIILDEAGLLSRATVAALSLLAARRVVLVGDPRQLAPISRISRILPSPQARWLGSSALNHLQLDTQSHGLELLTTQHRMHPQIRAAVSAYQYDGRLRDAPGLEVERNPELPERRAIWYVLDEEKVELHRLRADRGEGNRSWIRAHTPELLAHLFDAIPALRDGNGIFLSPFVGQTRAISSWIKEGAATTWRASTVHQQQGAEADFVIFDTVNAGSHCWPLDEWARLLNVAVSRARKLFILLTTRAEAAQPFLSPLIEHLWPAALAYSGRSWSLREVARTPASLGPASFARNDPRLGAQLARRRALHPILSAEQQRLSRYEMDGKPRLVRGVAGSGKTVVLASWLVQAYLRRRGDPPSFWIVFANEALRRLITRSIEEAWTRAGQKPPAPWAHLQIHHIHALLTNLEAPRRVSQELRYDYNARAKDLMKRGSFGAAGCDALFLDEAQDLGPDVIALLARLTKQSVPLDEKSRAINIFYDNAQNVYGRGAPKWVDLGIDLRGRSVIMKESFRSTRPITELAVNVLARLTPFEADVDQREYIKQRFLSKTERDGKTWWQVNYNEIDGPVPTFTLFANREKELAALGDQIVRWIEEEKVQPRDLVVVTMGRHSASQKMGELVAAGLDKRLRPLGLRAEHRTQEGFEGRDDTVVVTTPHSFKGYEAEIVCAFGLDAFHAEGRAMAAPLYVALTRARSVLFASASVSHTAAGKEITAALQEAADHQGGDHRGPTSRRRRPLPADVLK